MCGVAAQTRRALDWFMAKTGAEKLWEVELFDAYNIRPTDTAAIVTEGERGKVAQLMKFGLIPFFSNSEKMEYATFNAKVETVENLASYRGPFKKRQFGILVVDGFYEFEKRDKERIPHYFSLKSGEPLLLAVIYDVNKKATDKEIKSFSIITVPSNDLVGEVHDKKRMPAQLTFDEALMWLDSDQEVGELKKLLKPFPDQEMQRWMVSKAVNNSRSNGADLITPI